MEKNEAKTKYTLSEKLENYWYHYKWHTIGGLVALLIVIMVVSSLFGRETEDYRVILGVNAILPESVVLALEEDLEAFAEDLDGNGEVKVRIVDVSVTEGDGTELEIANNMKRLAELQTDDIQLMIFDDTYKEFYMQVTDEELFEDGFNWNGTELRDKREEYVVYFSDDLYFVMRAFPESKADNAQYTENWQAAKDLLDKLKQAYPAADE